MTEIKSSGCSLSDCDSGKVSLYLTLSGRSGTERIRTVPSWAFFRRQQISDDDQHAQEQAEQGTADALKALLADADRVSISEKDGVQEFSATFDLTRRKPPKEKKRSWWERVFTRRRVPEN
jgi:hypothetical protein